jgi:hypothetical protein
MLLAPVEPVPASAPSTGLLASAYRPSDNARWESGFSWRPERCTAYDSFNPCVAHTKNPASNGTTLVNYVPNGFVVKDECMLQDGRRDPQRVIRQAEAITSRVMAEELWTGAISTANPATIDDAPHVNQFLDDGTATAVAGTFNDYETALAALEAAAMDASNGMQVFLHIPVNWVLPIGDLLVRRGNLLYTPLDNVVVADAGYPIGNEAFATGTVSARVSDIEVLGAGNDAQTISRLTNRETLLAERLFAAYYDPCVHFSVTVTAP